MKNLYDFTVKDNHGNDVSLDLYKNKVLLIVNTATKCGLTPQYGALQTLYDKYKEEGFEILDFPCNQFLEQAPGSDEEINTFCTTSYNTSFPRFSKVEVNGENAAPLFVWLKEQATEDVSNDETKQFEEKVKEFTPKNVSGDIKWNFCKFLIDRNGNVAARFSPAITPEKISAEMKPLL